MKTSINRLIWTICAASTLTACGPDSVDNRSEADPGPDYDLIASTPVPYPTATPTPAPANKVTTFSFMHKGYIEGAKLNCTDFANSFGSIFSPIQWLKAKAFCEMTKANFRETATGATSRIKENFGVKVTCNGGTFVRAEKVGGSPICSMGTETIGGGAIHLGTGRLGTCSLLLTGSGLTASVSGSPPVHLDTGLQLLQPRLCTDIAVGYGTAGFSCKPDGTATFTGQTWGTNFPSLYWSVTRVKPDGTIDSATKIQQQTDMSNLWRCNSGGMQAGTKGLITLN